MILSVLMRILIGDNIILSNGGNTPNSWRTLTKAEWVYILEERQNATNLCCRAVVNNVKGLILLPDNYEFSQNIPFVIDADGNEYCQYTIRQWMELEALGAVFFPCAKSRRDGIRIHNDESNGPYGHYWSTTRMPETTIMYKNTYNLVFGEDMRANCNTGSVKWAGYSVRLVQDVE